MLIFERSRVGRKNPTQYPNNNVLPPMMIPVHLLRQTTPCLPTVSELDVVRHYTRLSQKNFSIDTHFYPLGSCTMKYNPRVCHSLASLPGFLQRHPLAPDSTGQGILSCLWELQEILAEVTGMQAVSLTPMAGAQGEFAGIAMIRAYHAAKNDHARCEIIVPDAAHGTNPATATLCGYTVKEIKTDANGNINLDTLGALVGPHTAGLMLTNPSTLGVFESNITEVAAIIHQVGGLLYYDGANLNAILGKVRPGDMGFDVIHLNLHKTFSTPHGGGGPGSGAVGVGSKLTPYLPIPYVKKNDAAYFLTDEHTCPQTIGRLSAFLGNTGVLLRAWVYARLLGATGMPRVAEFATLNANYLMVKLQQIGFTLAYPQRRASHEFIVSCKDIKESTGVTAMDIAKRLLDYGFHAPTTYFPLRVPECLLIEPTETESKETLDAFIQAMACIRAETLNDPEHVKKAPHKLGVRRPDDVKAVKMLDITYHVN